MPTIADRRGRGIPQPSRGVRRLPRGIRRRAVYVGLSKGKPTISPELFIHKEISLFGTKVLPGTFVPEISRFLLETSTGLDRVVSRRYSLDEAPRAFQEFNAGAAGKFIFLTGPKEGG